jgi:hypothetical protein
MIIISDIYQRTIIDKQYLTMIIDSDCSHKDICLDLVLVDENHSFLFYDIITGQNYRLVERHYSKLNDEYYNIKYSDRA